MRSIRKTSLYVSLVFLLLTAGCFKAVVETRGPLPDIIWPEPPEVPRIRFVNSISKPEHFNIKEKLSDKFMKFFRGERGAEIVKPYGIAVDAEGRLYVVDNFIKQVHVFDPTNDDYHTFPGKETDFVSPIDLAIDGKGTIYVSDSKAAVVKIFTDHGKRYMTEIGTGVLSRPTGLAVNRVTNELLVLDTLDSEIVRYDTETYTFKGTFGRTGDTPGTLHSPTNIFVSKDGNIFVSDSLNFRIQIFSPDGTFIRSFGKAGDSPGFFARPRGVAVDSDGNIYVVDAIFDNVQIFNSNGELLMDFGKPGSQYGEFWLPSGIFIDSNDRIYVADSYNKRIQVFQYMKGDALVP